MSLPIEKYLQMWEMLNKNVKVSQLVSAGLYEKMVILDRHGNKMEIKFYANMEEK
ncbi:hypothetical protein [Staphylococcus hyicus]|uniref:Uncharacterized protein n=1 Tax=Staphylococcus hyicus TaxID=1284 RepID=A0ACD5FNI2_STAHY|nr:hypothetical protein [Staphylococcus hyicus]AJC95793.1 hypothetical protein SHYC_05175 [Staphylococcus hyicus]MDP4462602.1 hypothetical protein [Staphylococcus hyicus]SQE47289.1 Uncharacterised protein [Staphylococcus hyicus]